MIPRLLTISMFAVLASPVSAAPPAKGDEGPPPLTYQIVTVHPSGSGEQGSVLLEQQTGRSWILMQRGSAPPTWQALPFESGFSLNQQLSPPEAGMTRGDRR